MQSHQHSLEPYRLKIRRLVTPLRLPAMSHHHLHKTDWPDLSHLLAPFWTFLEQAYTASGCLCQIMADVVIQGEEKERWLRDWEVSRCYMVLSGANGR